MITESINKIHNNMFFEFLVVYKNDVVIGFINLFAHSKRIISCGPTIKDEFKCKGFGFEAERLALGYAKDKGFTIAVGGVDDNNIASIRLHEKLGFELERKYSNKQGEPLDYILNQYSSCICRSSSPYIKKSKSIKFVHPCQNENPVDYCRQDFCFVLFIFHHSIFIILKTDFRNE